jgi:hypothetical protein
MLTRTQETQLDTTKNTVRDFVRYAQEVAREAPRRSLFRTWGTRPP